MAKKLAWLLILLASLSLLRTLFLLWNNNLADFNVFYGAAKALLEGQNPYSVLSFSQLNYLPTVIFAYVPFAFFPGLMAGNIFTVLSVTSFLSAVYLLKQQFRLSTLWISIIFLLGVLSFPFKFTLGMGQVNNIVLFFICLSLYFLKPADKKRSAVFLSVAGIIKIFPSVISLAYLARREYGKFVIFAAAILLLILIPYLFGKGWLDFYYFKNVFSALLSNRVDSTYYNQSLAGAFQRIGLPADLANLLRIIIPAVSLAAIFIRKTSYAHSFSLLIITMLLINPFSWQHHFVLLLLPFAFLITKSESWITLLILLLSYLLVAYNFKNTGHSAIILSHVFFGTVILYLFNLKVIINEK
jgi:hypothetical protein